MGANGEKKRAANRGKAQDLINMFAELQRLKSNWAVFGIAVRVAMSEDNPTTQRAAAIMTAMEDMAILLETEIYALKAKVRT